LSAAVQKQTSNIQDPRETAAEKVLAITRVTAKEEMKISCFHLEPNIESKQPWQKDAN